MSRNPLGWDYPAGAENDPNAPWNQPDIEACDDCGDEHDPDDLVEHFTRGGRARYLCRRCDAEREALEEDHHERVRESRAGRD